MALGSATTISKSPHQQCKDCAHDRSNKTGTLIRAVPPNGLTKICGNKCADDAEDRRENKALTLVRPAPLWVMRRAACFAPRVPFSRSRQSVCPRSQCRRDLAPSWHHPQADRFWTEAGDSFVSICEHALTAVSFPAASAPRWRTAVFLGVGGVRVSDTETPLSLRLTQSNSLVRHSAENRLFEPISQARQNTVDALLSLGHSVFLSWRQGM